MTGMTGWKSKAAGIGSILTGAGFIVTNVVATPIDVTGIMEGWGLILAGLAILGISHKIEKAAPPSS
jgi:hypothetical protein